MWFPVTGNTAANQLLLWKAKMRKQEVEAKRGLKGLPVESCDDP